MIMAPHKGDAELAIRYSTALSRTVIVALALALGFLAAGCGGGGGGGSTTDTTAPAITSPAISASTIQPVDQALTITAHVTDNVGVSSVVATLTPTSGPVVTITMTGSSGNYSGTWGANIAKSPGTYQVRIVAKDTLNNTATSAAMSLTVEGPPLPPT